MPLDVPPPPPPPPNTAFIKAMHKKTEAAAELSPSEAVETHFPTAEELSEVYSTIGLVHEASTTSETAWTPTKWWKTSNKEMDVDIDGYDFDFLPKNNVNGEKVSGKVDGPFHHDGSYKILKNSDGELELKVNVGTNSKRNNDLDVTIWVVDGQATLTGKVKGVDLGDGVTATVTGNGTKSSPWSAKFVTDSGDVHTIKWRPD